MDKGVFKEILNIVKKKPEAIALLQTLSKYPNVVESIKFPDEDKIKNLSMDEKKIFNALQILDDRNLEILVDYYSNISQDNDLFRLDSKDDLFRIDSKSSSEVNDEESDIIDEQLFRDSEIAPSLNVEVSVDDINEISAINEEAAAIYDAITILNDKD